MRLLGLLALCLWPLAAQAQDISTTPLSQVAEIDPTTLSDEDLLDLLRRIEAQRGRWPRRVGIFGIPSGFGVPPGIGFVSAGVTNRRDRRRVGDWDASLAFGVGLGDPVNAVGIAPIVDITSVSPYHFAESGKIGLGISRILPLGPVWQGSVALDLDNLITWGDSNVLNPEWSLAASVIRPADAALPVPLMLSAGYGSGVANRGIDPGWFGGVGVGLSDSVGVSLGWYGDEGIAGANFWLGRQKNLQISLGVGDITDNVSGRRVLLAVSLAGPLWRR